MIVAGFGFRASAGATSLHDALAAAAGGHRVTALATADDKAATPAFRAFAAALGLPVFTVDAAAICAQPTTTHSSAAQAARGTGSLAEAAALASAGPGARLLRARAISKDRMASCALAERQDTP